MPLTTERVVHDHQAAVAGRTFRNRVLPYASRDLSRALDSQQTGEKRRSGHDMTNRTSSDAEQKSAGDKARGKPIVNVLKWVAGIAAAVIGPLLVLVLTGVINPPKPPEPPPMDGHINTIQYVPTNSCCEFAVNFTLKGFKGQKAHWEAAVTDLDANTTSDPMDLNATSEAQANEDTATFELTVPINGHGDFFVWFILMDPKGTQLDRKSSDDFTS